MSAFPRNRNGARAQKTPAGAQKAASGGMNGSFYGGGGMRRHLWNAAAFIARPSLKLLYFG